MIIKIIEYPELPPNATAEDKEIKASFFDNFDYVRVKHNKLENTRTKFTCAVSLFTRESTKYALELQLFSKDNILNRLIYVDSNYSIYLLSNEGRTIERIN